MSRAIVSTSVQRAFRRSVSVVTMLLGQYLRGEARAGSTHGGVSGFEALASHWSHIAHAGGAPAPCRLVRSR